MKVFKIIAVSMLLLSIVSSGQNVKPLPPPEISITSIEDAAKQLKELNKEIIATAKDEKKNVEAFIQLKKFATVLFSKYTIEQLSSADGAGCGFACTGRWYLCMQTCNQGEISTCAQCNGHYTLCLASCPSND